VELKKLFAPRTIAIVGASRRETSSGYRIMGSLAKLGYSGAVYPVNPAYEHVLGQHCYADLGEIPSEIDAVALCVDARHLEAALLAAGERGVGAAVIFSSIVTGDREEGQRLRQSLGRIAGEYGMALCGPNCMGVLSPVNKTSMYLGTVLDSRGLAGNVALITQSGSVAIGMLGDTRRFGFSHVVSSGEEVATTVADYIGYLIDDRETAVIAAFVETVRDVAGFTAALDRASERNKPVVILKIGRNPLARRAVLGHTGGIAGDGAVFSALLQRHRAIEVTSLDELTEVLACLQNPRRPAGPRIGVVTASGGQVEMILDEAQGEAAGDDFVLPPLDEAIAAAAAEVIGPISGTGNPLDAWGDGNYARNMSHGMACMAHAPNIDVVVLVSDTNEGQAMAPTRYTDFFLAASEATARPFYFMNTRSGLLRAENIEKFAGSGVGMLTGLRPGLAAIGRVGRWQSRAAVAAIVEQDVAAGVVAAREALGRRRRTIHEADSKILLRMLGLQTVEERLAWELDTALAAATELGYPVVLKAVSDEIPHRSEHRLVVVGIEDESALRTAWVALDGRIEAIGHAPSQVARLVQRMVPGGVEVIIGTGTDPEIGAFIAFGAGGVLVELIGGRAVRPLPLRAGDAAAMIEGSRIGKILGGYRGTPACDRVALVEVIERLAAFAYVMRDEIAEIDLNPVFVRADGMGCIVADALIVPA
jgi:acyl-CoA synthetase (NDP forming)